MGLDIPGITRMERWMERLEWIEVGAKIKDIDRYDRKSGQVIVRSNKESGKSERKRPYDKRVQKSTE